jgi:hypothetical protein
VVAGWCGEGRLYARTSGQGNRQAGMRYRARGQACAARAHDGSTRAIRSGCIKGELEFEAEQLLCVYYDDHPPEIRVL